MEIIELVNIIIFIILLILSAFFSGSETAFFSLSELDREKLRTIKKDKAFRSLFMLLLKKPDKLLITILTGNMIVNIFASSISEYLGKKYFSFESDFYTIATMTIILIIFGEMTPKNIAVKKSLSFARISGSLLYYIHMILYPITFLLDEIKEFFLALFPYRAMHNKSKQISLVKSAVSIGYNEGVITDYESRLLESFISMRNEKATDVMLPRNMIVGIEIDTSLDEVLDKFKEQDEMYSLYPVFRRDLDHIAGYIDVKDLIGYKLGKEERISLQDLVKTVLPVPESKNVVELMKEMREKDIGMALIVDEYGGTAGIITFQHLIRDIFEYFYSKSQEEIRKISEDAFIVSGGTSISNFGSYFDIEINSERKTIAGLVLDILEDIPKKGDKIEFDGFEITVNKIMNRRILELLVKRRA